MSGSKFQGKHSDITDLVLNAFYKVHRKLGYGFNEKIYENSLVIELRKLGLQVAQLHEIEVFYDGQPVGTYFADLIVNDVVMLELPKSSALRARCATGRACPASVPGRSSYRAPARGPGPTASASRVSCPRHHCCRRAP